LESNRKVFDERRKLKEVKTTKGIKGENGEDELLLVNQKPAPKVKARSDSNVARPATIRLRSLGERTAPEDNLVLLPDAHAEAEASVNRTIKSRKEQHRKWNAAWQDRTWNPITPPPEPADEPPRWAPLIPQEGGYPTPPPSFKSGSPVDGDGDVDMQDRKPSAAELEEDPYSEHKSRIHIVPAFSALPLSPMSTYFSEGKSHVGDLKSQSIPQCRIRHGRGGRRFLEARRTKVRAVVRSGCGVVSDSDSDEDEVEHFIPVSDDKIFEYRMLLNRGGLGGGAGLQRSETASSAERRPVPSEEQSAAANAANQAQPSPKPPVAAGTSA
jgi:enhancer of polycomb-like protein